MSTEEQIQIKCQICKQLVNENELFRSKLNEREFIVGHKDCIEKRLQEKGLNESIEAEPKKTGLLFEGM